MKCTNCGAEFTGKFCSKCGAAAPAAEAAPAAAVAPAGAAQKKSVTTFLMTWRWCIVAAFGALVLFFTGHFVWGLVLVALCVAQLPPVMAKVPKKYRVFVDWGAFILTLFIVVLVVSMGSGNTDEEYCIWAVQNTVSNNHPDVTYGEALDAYFTHGEWVYKGDDVVEYIGTAGESDDLSLTLTLQFKVDGEKGTVTVLDVFYEGEAMGQNEAAGIMQHALEVYDG